MTQPKQAAGSRSGGASRRTRSAPAGKRAGAKAAPPNAPGPEEDREALDALRDALLGADNLDVRGGAGVDRGAVRACGCV